ncbi:MAG: hypothetical protein C0473_04260 [Cyanobacteria bacterium DS3.002]|nr:hypothetical protein [Cyanobacteria bacterium DS3.002]
MPEIPLHLPSKTRNVLIVLWIILVINVWFRCSFIYEPLNIGRVVLGYLLPICAWLVLEQAEKSVWKNRLIWIARITGIGASLFLFFNSFYDGQIRNFIECKNPNDSFYDRRDNLQSAFLKKQNLTINVEKITGPEIQGSESDVSIQLVYVRTYWGILKDTKIVSAIFPCSYAGFEISKDQESIVFVAQPAGSRKTRFEHVFSTDWNKVSPAHSS